MNLFLVVVVIVELYLNLNFCVNVVIECVGIVSRSVNSVMRSRAESAIMHVEVVILIKS